MTVPVAQGSRGLCQRRAGLGLRAVVVFAGLLSVSLAAPSRSAAKGLAVFRLDPLGVEQEIVARLEALLRNELSRLSGAPLPTPQQIAQLVATDRGLANCTAAVACLSRAGRRLGVDQILAGNVGGLAGSYVLNMKVVDVAHERELRRIQETISGEPDQLIEAVRVAAYRLTAPDRLRGTLVVLANVAGADVSLDGQPLGRTPLPARHGLSVGEHTLRVSQDRLHGRRQVGEGASAQDGARDRHLANPDGGARAARAPALPCPVSVVLALVGVGAGRCGRRWRGCSARSGDIEQPGDQLCCGALALWVVADDARPSAWRSASVWWLRCRRRLLGRWRSHRWRRSVCRNERRSAWGAGSGARSGRCRGTRSPTAVRSSAFYPPDRDACLASSACLAKLARRVGASWAVGGEVGRLGSGYIVYLRLVDRASREVRAISAVVDVRRPRTGARELAYRLLLPARFVGTLAVKIDVQDAWVYIDGRRVAKSPVEALRNVPVGTHALRVTHPEYRDFVRFVRVDFDRRATVEVRLSAFPVARGHMRLATRTLRDHELPWYRRWWALTVFGAVVAGATTAVILSIPRDVSADRKVVISR